MKFESHLNYQRMIELPSEELRPLLGEIKAIVEGRVKAVLSDFDDMKNIKNRGAQDNKYVHDRNKRSAYFSALDLIVSELNDLGHQLLPIDYDSDIDFESTSVSWATDFMSANARGLDIEIFPSKTQVLWVLSPNA
ncbi:hypothetical protein [Shewanella fidelis]|uniref:Uncharacterized protein n=1 Tax=Shewanella fidelis TaxID=173509 RepID=A0AAW8NPP6_9GAMM|nr:hypothetical protein [Shewanella fidelis]MDR8525158.1 hypothetical protein [Shewanella fidelis]MDW4811229.1 hypothetical protein [Shewanella fidelis]MDW4814992.1 hypothetical protein [Shewanella fidelis]MDW4819082.1 hypothetical protein [Shewanella fidelis]MDW4823240.1 hypothetical protein [Shewanella fidelis]